MCFIQSEVWGRFQGQHLSIESSVSAPRPQRGDSEPLAYSFSGFELFTRILKTHLRKWAPLGAGYRELKSLSPVFPKKVNVFGIFFLIPQGIKMQF